MRRRDFITLLGSAAAWPLAARAQERERVRRVGVLMGYGETDPEAKVLLSEFNQGLAELGWRSGRNLRMDIRWAPGNVDQMPSLAKELVGLQPEVILANSTPVTLALQRETQTIPNPYSLLYVIQWVRGSLQACPPQVGISPVSATQKPRSRASGLSCLWVLCPG